MDLEVKSLKYSQLPGLSERQLKEHHDILYAGYVKKVNEIRQKLASVDRTNPNATYSDLRELKVEETFALNGVKLHEGYFDNMGGTGGMASGAIAQMIEQDFGSFDNWLVDFKASGIAARGWVVLAFDLDDTKLHNYSCDVHNQGGVWNSIPLLILDVYEHAYFLDYATSRKDYIETFMKNINWEFVDSLIERFKIKEFRKS